jgi:Autotransporter beta-domain
VFTKSVMIRPAAALVAAVALMPSISHSQAAGVTPTVLPVLTGQTGLQTTIGTAVATMCVQALDQPQFQGGQSTQQKDLHDQCHALAGAVVTTAKNGSIAGQATALGHLQQVSGNQISTQGALATRAVAGQFANISGRLTALRFGSSGTFGQGNTANADEGRSTGLGTLASMNAQSYYRGQPMSDSNTESSDFAPSLARYVPRPSEGGLIDASYFSDGSVRLAQSDSSNAPHTSSMSAAPLAGAPNPWGVFVQGSYTSGRHDQTSNEDPFHFHASSVTGGIDYNFGSAVLGASVGYDDYDASFRAAGDAVTGGGSAQVKSTSGSLYGAWFGQNWNFNAIATYGHLKTDVSRNIKYTATFDTSLFADPQGDLTPIDKCVGTICTVSVDRTLQGDPDGHTVAVGATVGYDYSAYSWNISPSLSANYRRSTISSFTETDPNPPAGGDGLALAFNDQTVESLRSILGVAVSRPVSVPFGVLTPIFRIEWDHEYKTGARAIGAHYAFDPTAKTTCLSCFGLPTDSTPPNYGIAGLGVSVTLARRIQAFIYDEALIGYDNYHSNSIALGARVNF